MTRSQFSPIRMTASTQEAAVEQALQIVGASHDDVSVEVLSQDAKGVTVRVSPRRDDEIASNAPIEIVAPVESVEETLIDSEIEAGDASEAALMIEDEASEDEATAEMEADVEEVDAPVAQTVGIGLAEFGSGDGKIHCLFLKQRHAQRFPEDLKQFVRLSMLG